jgi:hypothetical protein
MSTPLRPASVVWWIYFLFCIQKPAVDYRNNQFRFKGNMNNVMARVKVRATL